MGGSVDLIVSREPERAWERIKTDYAHQAGSYLRAHTPDGTALTSRFAATRCGLASVRLSVLSPDEAMAEIEQRIDGLPVAHPGLERTHYVNRYWFREPWRVGIGSVGTGPEDAGEEIFRSLLLPITAWEWDWFDGPS